MTISVLSEGGGGLNFDDEYNDIESKRSPLLQGEVDVPSLDLSVLLQKLLLPFPNPRHQLIH